MSRGGQRTPAPLTSELDLGREAYAQNRWREALEHLGAADAEGGLGPRDLVRFAHSAYWTGSLDRYLGLLERAYAAFLDAGEEQEAALAALMLQWDYLAKPATSLATGWYRRAERILQPCPECAAHGYLAQARLWDALAGGEMETALREARRIAAVGERVGDADLQVLGLLRQGQVLVARGDPAAGLERIDEAVVAAISGELGTMATAVVYCGAIASCRELADWERIGQWSGAATRWCERQACTGFPGLCRIYTAELTSLRGEWDRAEEELQRGAEELRRFGAPGMAAAGFYELGEIRRRLGDLAAARSAYTQAYELGLEPQPGLALLWLAEDDASAASAAIAGALQGTDGAAAGAEPSPGAGRLRRARLLAAQVEIELAAGDSATAAAAASELEAIAAAYGTKALRAAAAQASAAVALERGRLEAALSAAERARLLWQQLEAPYEMARAQKIAAVAHEAGGDSRSAQVELRSARAVFERLGAGPELAAAGARIDPGAGGEAGGASLELSPRELDVLRLAAEGLTDSQIASRLVLSPHTVHRHLSNIRTKTNQRSRTAAVAQAARAGLI